MLTGTLLAWLAYGLGALGLVFVTWRITRSLRREWSHLLIVSVAVLLLTPAGMAVDDTTYIAPALFVLVLDGLFETLGNASRAGLLLLGAWLLALVASLVYQLVVHPRIQRRH